MEFGTRGFKENFCNILYEEISYYEAPIHTWKSVRKMDD